MNLNPKKISAHASLNDLLQMSLNHNNNSNNSNNNNMATPSSSSATVEVTKPSSFSAAASAVPFHGPIKTLQPQTEPRIKDNLDHDSKQQQQQQQHYHRKLHFHSNAESSNKDLPPQVIVTIQTAPIASGVHDFNQDLIQTSTSSEFESSPQRHSHHRRVHSDYSDYNRFPTTTLLDYDYDSITNIHRNTKSSSSMIHTDPKNNPFRSPLTPQTDTLPSETQTLTSSRTFPIAASSGSPLRSSLPLSSPLSFQDSDFDSSQVPSRRPKSSSQILYTHHTIPTTSSTTAPTPTPSTTNTTSPIPLPSFSVRPTTSLIARGNNLMRSKSMTASTSTTTTTPVMITYDNVASDHHNKAQQEYEYKQEYGHSKSLTLDTASLAEIAAQLSYLKPVVHQDLHATTTGNSTTCSNTSAAAASAAAQANNTIPSNPIRQDSHDSDHNVHLVTLGDDPGDCTTGKKRHRRLGGSAPITSIVNANSITTTSTTATPTTTTNNPVRTNNHSASVIHSVSTVSEKDELIHRRSFSAGWSNVWGNIAGASGGSSARPNSGGGASSSHSRKSTPTATASTLLVTDTHTSLASLDLDLTPIIVEKEIKIRSSEQDPTPHQVSIPSASETLFQAKLCAMMENYRNVDQNFDFSCLINMSQDQIQSLMKKGVRSTTTTNIHVQKSSYDLGGLRRSLDSSTDGNNYASHGPIKDLLAESQSTSRRGSMESLPNSNYQGTISSATTFQTNVPLNMHNKDLFNYNQQQIMAQHEPILTSVLEAGDLVLEGFYHEGLTTTQKKSKAYDTSKEKSTQDRMEVAIFKSDTRRQICVVYQDSTENQANPVKKREQKDGVQRLFRKDGDNRFSEEQPFSVYPPFRKAYMSNLDVERQVFAKLDELVEQNPFYDVIMTGHSMGAVLSVLSSMRYADLKPAIMVSCFAFGCPKVGSLDFRFYVHSLPNLKVVRFEYGYDPFTACPDHPSWVHLGHTILITKKEISKSGSSESLPHLQASEMSHVLHDPPVKAYKFGNVRPESSGVATRVGALGKILNRHRERNMDHELSSYVHVLEAMQGIGSQWPTVFVGEDGSGVQGLNDEKRHVC